MDHVEKFGIGEIMNQTIDYLDPNDKHPFHISFDVDVADPYLATQTGTRFRYGLEGRESVHIIRRLAHERRVVGLDIT
jgi:arginase